MNFVIRCYMCSIVAKFAEIPVRLQLQLRMYIRSIWENKVIPR